MSNLWILDISINVNLKNISYQQNFKVKKDSDYNYSLAKYFSVKKHFSLFKKSPKYSNKITY